jgi:enamine deaminase RidA (YjgF/YER057c/UK114 family)
MTAGRHDLFGGSFPASALIGVASLMPKDALIEIQAVAVLADERPSPVTAIGTGDV